MIKKCGRCKLEKPIEEFFRNSARPDGHEQYCKQCSSANRKERYWNNHQQELQSSRRYSETHRAEKAARGRQYAKANRKRERAYRLAHLDETRALSRAHMAVLRAIKSGKLVRPDRCENCKSIDRVDAHHHIGYDTANLLNVTWLCHSCHLRLHRSGDAVYRVGSTTNLGLDASAAPSGDG
jgi:hypothetical protein